MEKRLAASSLLYEILDLVIVTRGTKAILRRSLELKGYRLHPG